MNLEPRERDCNRKFYDLPVKYETDEEDYDVVDELTAAEANLNSTRSPLDLIADSSFDSTERLFDLIAHSEIGHNERFYSPFGLRRVVYCDHTASGRSLNFFEDFIRNQVLPDYGNTHTTSSVTALQTTLFRTEARDIIKSCVNASEHDSLIFVGAGCTGAVHKLINALNLTEPPIVFVSPYEHHSNLLPWREIMSEIVFINEAANGSICLMDLETKLKAYANETSRVKIGTFSAASNITGIISDVNKITILLHKYGFLSFWDYAAAAPHLEINMNPYVQSEENKELAYKDAVFISTHKFVGGPQTPGILLAKKKLFQNRVPNGCGGGTVFYVTRQDHRYLKNEEQREEGGTPAIVESIRAGLVFQLKHAIGSEAIMRRENHYTKKAIEFFSQIPNIRLLGSTSVERLSIFSFLIKHEQTGLYLHSNFVCSLLNDLFGVQTRAGCACAGPYAHYLLGMDQELAKAYEQVLVQDERIDRTHLRIRHDTSKAEIVRPGFVRLSLAYYISEQRVDFILEAVKFVCEHGWKFLPQYIFNLETGEFRHRNLQIFKDRKWLSFINYKNGMFNFNRKVYYPRDADQNAPSSDKECLEAAQKAIETTKQSFPIGDQRLIFNESSSNLRWFVLPSEAYGIIHGNKSLYTEQAVKPPFTPRKYATASADQLAGVYDAKAELLSGRTVEPAEPVKTQTFSDYASQFYYDEEIVNCIRLVRKAIIERTESDEQASTRKVKTAVNFFKKNNDSLISINNESDSVDQSKTASVESTNKADPICRLGKPAAKKSGKVEKNGASGFSLEWHSPAKVIFKPFVDAVEEFNMIKNGDKVLVCLSGGKDSMSLLHAIRQYQFVAKSKNINFEFGAVTVDPKTPTYNPSSLKAYLAELGVPYFYEEQTIIETAENLPYECASICSFCSRMKRGRLYHAARRNGYNVLAFGQHLDDAAESFVMSLFYNGRLWSMKACYENEDGDLRIIRPFIYVREKELRAFAEGNRLPIIPENCPGCFEAPKERQRMKQLLAQQEVNFPCLFGSLLAALHPIISIDQCRVSIKSLSAYGLKMIKQDPKLYDELVKTCKADSGFEKSAEGDFI